MEIYVAEKKLFSGSHEFLSHCYEKASQGSPMPPIDRTGKPFFSTAAQSPDHSHFNLSHSGDYIVVAFHHSPLGLDLQTQKYPSQALLQRVCSARELQWLLQHPHNFPHLWVMKEAYCKYTGEGIGTGRFLSKLESPLPSPQISPEFLTCEQNNHQKPVHFTLWKGSPLPDDYTMALCSSETSEIKLIFLPEPEI